MLKKLDLYTYFVEKWVCLKGALLKINVLFFDKRWKTF